VREVYRDGVQREEGNMGRSGWERENGVRTVGRDEVGRGAAGEELAHMRARFAVDPSTPSMLADAWTSPTGALEEDESEFLDAVADCLSVGLPLYAAVASWRLGTLEVAASQDTGDDAEEDDTSVFEEDDTSVFIPASGRAPTP
jgi:hypothetical protein